MSTKPTTPVAVPSDDDETFLQQIELGRIFESLKPSRRMKLLRIMRLVAKEDRAPAKPFTTAWNEIIGDPTLSGPEKLRAVDRLLASLPS